MTVSTGGALTTTWMSCERDWLDRRRLARDELDHIHLITITDHSGNVGILCSLCHPLDGAGGGDEGNHHESLSPGRNHLQEIGDPALRFRIEASRQGNHGRLNLVVAQLREG